MSPSTFSVAARYLAETRKKMVTRAAFTVAESIDPRAQKCKLLGSSKGLSPRARTRSVCWCIDFVTGRSFLIPNMNFKLSMPSPAGATPSLALLTPSPGELPHSSSRFSCFYSTQTGRGGGKKGRDKSPSPTKVEQSSSTAQVVRAMLLRPSTVARPEDSFTRGCGDSQNGVKKLGTQVNGSNTLALGFAD